MTTINDSAQAAPRAPLYTRFTLVKSRRTVPKVTLRLPQSAAELFRPLIGDSAVEIMVVAGLSPTSEVLGVAEIARGGIAQCDVDPKVLFSALLLMGATGFILCHNHPSGDVQPSAADVALTRQLQDAGRLLTLRLVDHVIVTNSEQFSSLVSLGVTTP